MGTPEFAKKPLERLYSDGHDIAGVFTQPDKPSNRGMKVTFNPVKELAISRGTPIFQPASMRDTSVLSILKSLNCDQIIVVAYGKILPQEILDLPPLGCINIHGSLLPKYRGAAPIQWAVISGETETGVTSMYMAADLDSGDMLLTKRTHIDDDETAGDLYSRLSVLGAELVSETINAVSRGEAVRIPQNHSDATFAPPLKKDMSPIDWTDSAVMIKNKVRGLNPWPVATAILCGTIYKIFSVAIGANDDHKSYAPGEIVAANANELEVACADGTVIIKELQAPGGKRMSAADYLRGHRRQLTIDS